MADPLPLQSVIGFGGTIPKGLVLHPDGKTLIYPLGSTIVIRNKSSVGGQEFLQGHSDKVSCIAIARSGRYLASGQVTYMGFHADIIIWDLAARKLLHRMSLHKVKVQDLDFSADDQYLVSLGGQDDNSLVLWNVETGASICGSPTHSDFTLCVKFLNNNSDVIITAGKYNLNIWEHDGPNNKLRELEVQLGQLKRVFNCMCIDSQDRFVYCGTTSGDILQVSIEMRLMKNLGVSKGPIPLGVTASCCTPQGRLFVGAGDGSVRLLKVPPETANPKFMKKISEVDVTRLDGAIVSLVMESETQTGVSLLLGTENCNIYRVIWNSRDMRFASELLQTAHSHKINDLAVVGESSDVFVTCSIGSVRVWHLDTCREVLRIQVPNLECHCVSVFGDGSGIVSGWSDGAIRVFGPQSGKLLYSIHNAHHRAVTAIASTGDCGRIISGGEEGMVRVWAVSSGSQVMEASMKEHKGPVNCIQIKDSTYDECVSCSSDGSCIIWDLSTFKRRSSLFANTFFKAVVYQKDETQLVTGGTDRKITYWDPFDGQAIRIMEGSDEPINTLAIDADGTAIVSGSSDKIVRLWGYDEGHCYFSGVAHSGSVVKVAITHDKSRIISVGTEGGIFVWKFVQPPVLPLE